VALPAWLADLATGVVVATVTALLTIRLSLHRFRSERVWERKAEAYADLLTALSDLHRHAQVVAAEAMGANFSDDYRKRSEELHKDAAHRLRRATHVGEFVFSKVASKHLDDLRKAQDRLAEEWDQSGRFPQEIYEEDEQLYVSAIAAIRAAARADLRVGD
jgi:hypothetical protein